MKRWIRVCPLSEFTEKVRVIVYDGIPIAVFRLDDGFYAIEDECSHASAASSEGEITGNIINCPLHGAQFDIRTGQAMSLPAVEPVLSYPVKIEDDVIYVQVED